MKHPDGYKRTVFLHLREGMCLLCLYIMLAPAPAHAEYGDVILNQHSEKAGMRPVIFPHWLHRIRFKCNVCHTEIGFKMRTGADDISMKDIKNGKFCGACHDSKIAWGPESCNMCHSGLPGLTTGTHGGNATGGPGKM
jgi:c(7)-type cytochrome triheme protein